MEVHRSAVLRLSESAPLSRSGRIDYVLQSGPSGQVGRAWLGERLFSEHARLEIPEAHSLRTGNETLRLDSMSSEEVSERLRLSRESLERFGHWSSNQFRGSFKVIYVAEGGDPSRRGGL